MLRSAIFLLLLTLPLIGRSQAIDNTPAYRHIHGDRYFRFTYDNDFFTQKDEYYTQGIRFELVSPSLQKFPLTALLLHPIPGYTKYGIAIEHDAYTPSSISSDAILHGDRPFAACLMFNTFTATADTVRHRRFSASLSGGIIGPGAFGAEMQTYIHKHTHSILPHGWNNQIHNDIILNYEITYEKQLYSYGHILSANADIAARAGTLSDKANAGLTIMAGSFDAPFGGNMLRKKNYNLYVYDHLQAGAIGYDATLQGGLLNRTSPYYITQDNISRFTLENRIGIVLNYRKLYLTGYYVRRSKEFTTGHAHAWGGLQIAFGL